MELNALGSGAAQIKVASKRMIFSSFGEAKILNPGTARKEIDVASWKEAAWYYARKICPRGRRDA